jgi:apolipoprotein N-acyltransferase
LQNSAPAGPSSPIARLRRWHGSTLGLASVGALLLWAALPPMEFSSLAWIAPAWWVMLIRRPALQGHRPYLVLWVVGFLFWMAALHWLRLPHWATSFGWVALSAYFGCYLPVFVSLSRVAVHRLRVPVMLAAPVVWAGLELARAHLLTGMTMASLGHTQYRWPQVIQISDLGGAYAVGFVVMFVAAALGRAAPLGTTRWRFWPALPAAAMFAVVLWYGHARMQALPPVEPEARIGLIQGSVDIVWKADPELRDEIFKQHFELSVEAREEYAPLDLIVWPETMFRDPLVICDDDAAVPADLDWPQQEFLEHLREASAHSRELIRRTAEALQTPLLLGVDTYHYTRDGLKRYNSAIYVSAEGEIVGRYDKIHRVMFGEYVPFAETISWLHRLTPLNSSLCAGDRPAAFRLGSLRLAPNICYESVLSHVIRRQVTQLRRRGEEPDVLVNLTNDGWFWGSSELDMHLACGVFRAVECRKPLLIAANTGISAWIDGNGRMLCRGPRQQTATLLAEVGVDPRESWYLRHGDWAAGLCLVVACLFGLIGLIDRGRAFLANRQSPQDDPHEESTPSAEQAGRA